MSQAMSSVLNGFIKLAAAVAVAAIVAVASGAGPSFAQTKAHQYNVDNKGLLLRGYDPVAYFTSGKPTKGSDKITAAHNGATYHFASAANRDAFLKTPDKYAPVYGGFCAYGVANGYKVDGDPAVWKIVDGKLYLNINRSIGRKFEADTAGYIKQADAKWPGMRDKSAADVNK